LRLSKAAGAVRVQWLTGPHAPVLRLGYPTHLVQAQMTPHAIVTSEADFRRWFVDSLAPLREKGESGFVFLLVAFPLLERYLRRKSGCPGGHDLTDEYLKQHLGTLFSELAGPERPFWNCYRNGLLHHVTFPLAKLQKKNAAMERSPSSRNIWARSKTSVFRSGQQPLLR